jgi:hypothetical protein
MTHGRQGTRSRRGSVLLAAALVGLALAAGPARADSHKVLVLPFSGSVPGAPDAPRRFTEIVSHAVGLTGVEVVVGRASFADTATLAGCSEETPECIAQLAGAFHVDQVVFGALEPAADGKTVSVGLKFFHDGTIDDKSFSLDVGPIDAMTGTLAREVSNRFLPAGEQKQNPEPTPPPAPPPDNRPAPLPPPPPAEEGGFQLRRVGIVPWIVAGGGVALAAGGAGFLLVAHQRQNQVDDAPIHTASDFDHLKKLEDQGARYTTIGNVLLIAGGAAVATGAVLGYLAGRRGGEESGPPVAVGAAPLPGGFAVSFEVLTP